MTCDGIYKELNTIANKALCDYDEYKLIVDVLLEKRPCNFLVFGLGKDSLFWNKVNGGKTLFIEDKPIWIKINQKKSDDLSILGYVYGTKKKDYKKIINDTDFLMMKLPDDVLETHWDVIFIDAPSGGGDHRPGRMKSIYTASILSSKGTDVFLHDCDRVVEKTYSDKYFPLKVAQVNRMSHYKF